MEALLEAIAEEIVCLGILGFLTITTVAYYIAQAYVYVKGNKNGKVD
jgi:hypothetical protein